ncbi:MAG: D-alanine--D-alanine ligase [Planctomycetes bacterium]|nr:D-alanine--D-alanine ligase [Planctomycetota bacterium]
MSRSKARVAVCCGGPSSEREISLLSGRSVLAALREAGHVAIGVEIGRDGRFTFDGGPAVELERALPLLRSSADVVFPALHGAFGEDGTFQGLLECAGLRYVGSGVAAAALAMDKDLTRRIAQSYGIRLAPGVAARNVRDAQAAARVVDGAARLEFPAFVKPSRSGSSVGVTRVADAAALERAVAAALEHDDCIVVEQGIAGIEVSCPVIGDAGAGARALPVVEIVPKAHEFFDYQAKYTAGHSDEICPARIDAAATRAVQHASLLLHDAFCCRSMSRSDFIVPAHGDPVFLELNILPGMTPLSLLPKSAATAGMSYPELCSQLAQGAYERPWRSQFAVPAANG